MPLQTRSIRMWSGAAPPPEIITLPAINTARGLELGSATGEAALGRSTGPPAREGSLTLPRCAQAAETREITAAISLRRAEARCIRPPGHDLRSGQQYVSPKRQLGRRYSLRVLPISAMISCPSILLPS